ncbi:MAG: hypothetical protein U0840_23085 [Gemmataceae bacterium]
MLAMCLYQVFAAASVKVPIPADNRTLLYGGIAGGGVLFAFILLFLVRGKKKVDPEGGLAEDLAAIPAPGKGPRHYQLLVMNQPCRLRLVVIAPMGKKTVGKVDSALEQIFRGLGEVSMDDKPRVRIWPAQLSATGFAPTFFRLTKRPDPEGKPSRWILLAGPARAGGMPVLLGLAVQTDTPTKTGMVTLSETQWNEILRVENS